MSHIAQLEVVIKDLDALEVAARACGLELRRGQTHHAWWGSFAGDSPGIPGRDPATYGTCEHAIGEVGVKGIDGYGGPWEIGVVRRADGEGYHLVYDAYGRPGARLHQLAGDGLRRLVQEYGAEVATRQLRKQGYRIRRTLNERGAVVLTATEAR